MAKSCYITLYALRECNTVIMVVTICHCWPQEQACLLSCLSEVYAGLMAHGQNQTPHQHGVLVAPIPGAPLPVWQVQPPAVLCDTGLNIFPDFGLKTRTVPPGIPLGPQNKKYGYQVSWLVQTVFDQLQYKCIDTRQWNLELCESCLIPTMQRPWRRYIASWLLLVAMDEVSSHCWTTCNIGSCHEHQQLFLWAMPWYQEYVPCRTSRWG